MVRAPRVCGIVGADMHHTSNTLPMATAIEVPPYRALGWMRFALAMTVVMNGHSAWLAPDNAFVQWLAWMRGGGTTWTNLVTACRDCNQRKGGHTPEQAGMALLRRPFAPIH